MSDVTRILGQIEAGDPTAGEQLLPLVYQELRKLAAHKLSREQAGQTLQSTALVHEAYLRLLGASGQEPSWANRGHFFAAAAEAMRRILVDRARAKSTRKRGGDHRRIELSQAALETSGADWDLLDLDDAIDRLAERDSRAAQLVKLRFFAGLTREEAARSLGVTVATVDDDWAYAKGWLRSVLAETARGGD